MIENRQLIVLLHLCQLLDLLTGIGGLIVPLIIWATKKDQVYGMDFHGKQVLNFQLSMVLYTLIAFPLLLLFGLGILIWIAVGMLCIIFPVINAIKASSEEAPYYPLSIRFIK